MIRPSPWRQYYRVLPDGRFVISQSALNTLQGEFVGRILDTQLSGKSARVYLLDLPVKLDAKVPDGDPPSFYLTRIRLRELPGWPPRPLATPELPPLIDTRLLSVRFRRAGATEPEALEFDLDHPRGSFKAMQSGCPLELMRCELETLQEDGTRGRNLLDIQELRLIGPGA